MRIGLLGGTFDPIHRGHLKIAEAVFKKLQLDTLFFIPTGKPPHKKESDLAPRADRFRMVCLALLDHPHFKPCNIEIKRKGTSYTIDTLRALKRRYPKETFFLILGTDAFFHLPEWKAPEQLLKACSFVIVPRRGHPFSRFLKLALEKPVDKTALKQLDDKKRNQYLFHTPFGTSLYFIRITAPPISASDIRTGIKTQKKGVNRLLPPWVGSYIMQRGLYKKKETHSKKNCQEGKTLMERKAESRRYCKGGIRKGRRRHSVASD